MKASQNFSDYKVINAGSSGATSAYGISVIKFHLKRYKPELIVYALEQMTVFEQDRPRKQSATLSRPLNFAKEKKYKLSTNWYESST